MRNIYDIISEQKALVDVNMASHDLDYVTEHFMGNQDMYYIEEGLGEGLKNLGKKVVEFIKQIIAKIKELVNRVIDFFRKKEKSVEALEQKIEAANNGGKIVGAAGAASNGNGKAEPEKKAALAEPEKRKALNAGERRAALNAPKGELAKREEKSTDVGQRQGGEVAVRKGELSKGGAVAKAHGLLNVLKQSKLRVEVRKYNTLTAKMNLANKLFGDVGTEAHRNDNVKDFNAAVYNSVFKKSGEGALADKIRAELGEGGNETTVVSSIAEKIYDYLSRGEDAVKYLRAIEKNAEDNLNKLCKRIESGNNSTNENMVNMARAAANMISGMANETCKSVVSARNDYWTVAEKAVNAYAESL